MKDNMSETRGARPSNGMTVLAQRILRTLHEIGEPLTYRDLAREVEADPSTVQKEVDELVKAKLVEEVNHLHVREPREKRLGLTTQGYRISYPQTDREP